MNQAAEQPTPQAAPLRAMLCSSALAGVVRAMAEPPSWSSAAWSTGALAVTALPYFLFLFTRRLRHIPIALVAGLTWVYFCAPFLHQSLPVREGRVMPTGFQGLMAAFVALSVAGLVLGYYVSWRTPGRKPLSPTGYRLSPQSLERVMAVLLVAGMGQRVLLYYFPSLLRESGRLLSILDFCPVVGLCVGLLYFLRGGRSWLWSILLAAYFVCEFMLRVSETLFSEVGFLFAGLLFTYVAERRRIPWLRMAAVFLLIFPLFVARKQFRSEAQERWHFQSQQEKAKIPDLIVTGGGYVTTALGEWESASLWDQILEQSGTRLENVTLLGQCVYHHEVLAKPFRYGETFWWLPLTPIPRVLVPFKPRNYHASELAAEYGLRNPFYRSAANFAMLAEMYINFSWFGMVLLSFLQGLALRWVVRKAGYGWGDLNLLVFLHMLWFVLDVEGNITLVFGGMLQALVFWWVLFAVLRVNSAPVWAPASGGEAGQGDPAAGNAGPADAYAPAGGER